MALFSRTSQRTMWYNISLFSGTFHALSIKKNNETFVIFEFYGAIKIFFIDNLYIMH